MKQKIKYYLQVSKAIKWATEKTNLCLTRRYLAGFLFRGKKIKTAEMRLYRLEKIGVVKPISPAIIDIIAELTKMPKDLLIKEKKK